MQAGPATFLLDRVAEDMEERLRAVMRDFADAADIGTPGEGSCEAVADRFKSIDAHRSAGLDSEALPLQPESLDLASPRSPFSSSTICPACWRKSAAR